MPIGAALYFGYYLSSLVMLLRGGDPFTSSGPTGSEL